MSNTDNTETPEEIAAAKRLGITKPKCPAEVENYLALVADYYDAANEIRNLSLPSRYRYHRDQATALTANDEAITDYIAQLEAIRAKSANIAGLGQMVALAAQQWSEQDTNYRNAIEKELERPEREWRNAKNELETALAKEKRSIAIKLGRLNSKRWKVAESERAEIVALIDQLEARDSVIAITRHDISGMEYRDHIGTTFTADLVAQTATRNRERVDELLGKMDTARLAKAEAEAVA